MNRVVSISKPFKSPRNPRQSKKIQESVKSAATIQQSNLIALYVQVVLESKHGRMGKRKRKGLLKRKPLLPSKGKRQPKARGKHKAEIVDSERYIEIVFSQKYSQVLKEVEKLAEEQIRSTEEQIVFILKSYLKGVKESQIT